MAADWPNPIRLYGFVRASRKTDADTASLAMWPGLPPGYPTFTAPLVGLWVRRSSVEIGTYFACGVQINATQRDDWLSALSGADFSAREVTILDTTGAPIPSDNLWLFDGGTEPGDPGFWDYYSAMAALGLRQAVYDPDNEG